MSPHVFPGKIFVNISCVLVKIAVPGDEETLGVGQAVLHCSV